MIGPEVHVVSGDSAAGLLRSALGGRGGAILVHHDPLSVGPLPRAPTVAAFQVVREAFWRWVGAEVSAVGGADLLASAHELRQAAAVTIWTGAGAADQYLLPWVVHLFRLMGVPMPALSAVELERMPGKAGKQIYVASLGIVSPDQLRAQGQPRQLSGPDVTELEEVWAALTAPAPDALLRARERAPTSFSLLRRALGATIDRYPDVRTGLGHWDQELLRNVRDHGPRASMIIANTLVGSYESEYPDSVGDLYLFDRLRGLADPGLAHPAAVMTGDVSSFGGCEVRLSQAGGAFLDGSLNFVAANGIDDWVAGVHLDSTVDAVWFRDGKTLIRRPSPRP
jgi:Domain of unknown function (DUF1835)